MTISRRVAVVATVGLGAAMAAVAALLWWPAHHPTIAENPPVDPSVEEGLVIGPTYDTPFFVPGIQQPVMLTVAEAQVADDEPVIGVQIGGQARAYLLRAMSAMSSHVVNDLIGEVPLSVTYCDQTECARVLVSKERGKPIALSTGGFMNGQMAVRLLEEMYEQMSPDLPLDDLPFQRLSWGEWKAAHPGTVIFVGVPAR